ncbi:hypothetical protein LQW54_012682 [Pestalotiopsis sp. IQ-011]
MGNVSRTVYQPIHPSLRPLLDPQYAAFHDEHLQHVVPSEAEPWDPETRNKPSPLALGGQRVVDVGSVCDKDMVNFQLRVFTPEGSMPDGGWPVLVWFHGGGWVMGGLGSENGFLSHVCKSWLTPSRMMWYREMYFTLPTDAANWDASPCFAPAELLSQSPATFIGVSECDLLAPEALKFGECLKNAGITTQLEVYKGATHSILVLAGVGQRMVHDACTALSQALGTRYEVDSSPVHPLT